MKTVLGLATLLTLLSGGAALAQEPTDTARSTAGQVQEILQRSGVVEALDSVAATSAPDLQDALGRLAITLNTVADRIAGDAALRASALQAAGGVLELAQVVLVEQSDTLLETLRAATERIAERTAAGRLEPEVR